VLRLSCARTSAHNGWLINSDSNSMTVMVGMETFCFLAIELPVFNQVQLLQCPGKSLINPSFPA
jgi:hypothetical protein